MGVIAEAGLARAGGSPKIVGGRFAVERELGRGAQGAVYLAIDTRLGRNVAVKTLRRAAAGPATTQALRTFLDEARIVSTLQHPNIVQLFDAGDEDGAPYLVFEYVEGRTLDSLIRERGRLPAAQAVDIAIAIGRGIGYAHSRDVVHRDLKPANVMLTKDGVPRLMDFGIASRGTTAETADDPLTGTPSYMAPEYIANRTWLPSSDLFSLGIILYEMLAGEPPVRGASAYETLHRIANEPFRRLSQTAPQVDERLEALVMRMIAKEPSGRWPTVARAIEDLTRYLDPAMPERPAAESGAQGTLDFLLRRIRHKSDFPAFSGAIGTINRLSASEREPISALSSTILKDISLTSRLLKLVNAAQYNQYGGTISTVSRAVTILGVNGVRSVALSLMMFEHLHAKANAVALKDEVIAAYFGATLTRELGPAAGVSDAELAFICAMFRRLGRMLVAFYLHDESQAIAGLVQARGWDDGRAAKEVLGISYEELGVGVGKSWNFPEPILNAMRPLPGPQLHPPAGEEARAHVVAVLASSVSDAILRARDSERAAKLAELTEVFGGATGMTEESLVAAVQAALLRLKADAEGLGFSGSTSEFLSNAAKWAALSEEPSAAADAPAPGPDSATLDGTATLVGGDLAAPMPAGAAVPGARRAELAAGIQATMNKLVGEFDLNDVLRSILETMYRSMGFLRVILLVSDPRRNALRGRFGFGADVEGIVQRGFSIPLDGARDIFGVAVGQGTDICIEDIDAEKVRAHVPGWYRREIPAKGLLLLPIMAGKRPVGLIYADANASGMLNFDREELALLKTLRNQAVLAVRQKG